MQKQKKRGLNIFTIHTTSFLLHLQRIERYADEEESICRLFVLVYLVSLKKKQIIEFSLLYTFLSAYTKKNL